MAAATDGRIPPGGLQAVVRGLVQGVGFRWFVRRAARGGDLAGWVANLPDGSVRVVAAGPAGALDQLADALHRGPPGARVEAVEIDREPPARDLPHPFQIR